MVWSDLAKMAGRAAMGGALRDGGIEAVGQGARVFFEDVELGDAARAVAEEAAIGAGAAVCGVAVPVALAGVAGPVPAHVTRVVGVAANEATRHALRRVVAAARRKS